MAGAGRIVAQRRQAGGGEIGGQSARQRMHAQAVEAPGRNDQTARRQARRRGRAVQKAREPVERDRPSIGGVERERGSGGVHRGESNAERVDRRRRARRARRRRRFGVPE